jgi:hypothetical protein
VVTLQQASHLSFQYDTYTPYLSNLAAFVRQHAPTARIMIHQTWAYEDGSERLFTVAGYERAADMLRRPRVLMQSGLLLSADALPSRE